MPIDRILTNKMEHSVTSYKFSWRRKKMQLFFLPYVSLGKPKRPRSGGGGRVPGAGEASTDESRRVCPPKLAHHTENLSSFHTHVTPTL